MVGAGLIGISGIPIGWVSGVKKSNRPLHPRTNLVLSMGLVGGILFTVMAITLLIFAMDFVDYNNPLRNLIEVAIGALAFVPLLVFIPVGGAMMLSTWLLSVIARNDKPEVDQGVYCRSCHYDLRASLDSQTCPECGSPVVKEHLLRYAFGIAVAWRISWMSLILASVGTGIGWLVMIPCFASF